MPSGSSVILNNSKKERVENKISTLFYTDIATRGTANGYFVIQHQLAHSYTLSASTVSDNRVRHVFNLVKILRHEVLLMVIFQCSMVTDIYILIMLPLLRLSVFYTDIATEGNSNGCFSMSLNTGVAWAWRAYVSDGRVHPVYRYCDNW